MPTEFNKVKSGVIFTKAAQKQDLQSGDTIPEALGKLAKYMDVTDDALSNVQPILTFDSEPEYESLNPVTSGGLYDYIELQSPTYINTFSSESDLYSYSGNLTNNDYAFVGTGSGATYYMNVYQYKSEVIRDTIEDIKTTPSGSNILKTLNEPALPSGNIQYKLDCYVTAVNNQSYGTSPVITVIFSDNTTAQITVPNASKTHIIKTYSKPIKSIQFMNSGQSSDGYTDFEDIQILTTAGWNKLSYRLYNPTWDVSQLSAINSGITSTKVTNYDNHIANKSNPHEVTKSQVGLENVGNFKAVSTEASQGLTSTEQSNARTNINAQESLSFNGTYNASTNKVATESTVTDAINALDVSSQGGAGKYISEISETNGKISATPTTMDTSLSNSSTNNNCPTSKTVYDDQQRQDAALAEVENKGAKNRLPLTGESTDIFTINADGTMTANGSSSTSKRDFAYYIGAPPKGRFVFSGCPPTGSSTTYRMFLQSVVGSTYTTLATLTGDPVEVDLTNIDKISVLMSIYAGYTPNNIKFSPMLCTKEEWDISHTYVPYGKTNHELTVENVSQQAEINYAVNAGAKNLLDYTFSINGDTNARTSNGVTFTINADRSISTSGTASANITNAWIQRNYAVPSDPVILSGCPAGGAYNKYKIDILDGNQTGSVVAADYGNGVVIKSSMFSNGIGLIRIRIENGQNVDGLVFKPMIRPAAITDPTYEPYALPNPVLTQEVNWNVNNGVKNLFDINTSLPLKIYHTTYTLSDGSLTVTSNGSWGHHSVPVNLPAGNYIFTATISNFSKDSSASESSVRMRVTDTTATGGIQIASKAVTGNGAFELPFTWTGGQCYIQYYPNYTSTTTYVSSFTASNNMIRCDEIIDPTYEPYALPNPTLTPAAIKAVDEGAKNRCKLTATTQTFRNVTFTVDAESGTITANGTANATDSIIISDIITTKEEMFLTGTPSGASGYNVRFGSSATYRDTGSGVSIPSGLSNPIYFAFNSGTVFNNEVIKPMICTAADWAVSQKFVPYAPTNRELYESKVDHDLPVVSGSILDYADTFAPGIYFARQSSATGSGKPINNRRYVYNIYVYSQATATIIAIDGENGEDPMIYTANKVSGSWGQWIRSCNYTYGIIIPDNSDLNSYTTPGKYYGPNSAANTASNLPVARDAFNFTLTVEKVTPIHIVQHLQICRLADDPNIYRRRLYNNNWGSWYKFAGTEVTS